MTFKTYKAFITTLSAVTLMIAADQTFGAPAAGVTGARHSGPARSHSFAPRWLHHHRGNNAVTFWPTTGDYYEPTNGLSNGEPGVDLTQPSSRDVHYTYTNDVPWDWAHRYPPSLIAPEQGAKPYVPGCPAQTITVPGIDGKEQTINIVRCY